jgi:hypothetical protein
MRSRRQQAAMNGCWLMRQLQPWCVMVCIIAAAEPLQHKACASLDRAGSLLICLQQKMHYVRWLSAVICNGEHLSA